MRLSLRHWLRRALSATTPCAIVAASCVYSPTAIDVDISTVGICEGPRATGGPYRGRVTVFVGGNLEVQRADVETCAASRPSPGAVGNIVLTPSGDRDAAVTVEVLEGEKCITAKGTRAPPSADCITARRRVTFIKHERIRIPIVLREECRGSTCPAGETCVAGGKCVSDACVGFLCAAVEPPAEEEDDADAGEDASTIADTGIDARDGGPPRVVVNKCGEPGVKCGGAMTCFTGQSCCKGGGPANACASSCPAPSTVDLECDDGLDCFGRNSMCCLRRQAGDLVARCSATCEDGIVLCSSACTGADVPCGVGAGTGACQPLDCGGFAFTTCDSTCPL